MKEIKLAQRKGTSMWRKLCREVLESVSEQPEDKRRTKARKRGQYEGNPCENPRLGQTPKSQISKKSQKV
eukprot:1052105-Amphidinium_carterae.1